RIFRKAGSDLEIIYRQRWLDGEDQQYSLSANLEKPLDR
ncbi:MAG: MotA/TolQ/ExbB proton channel family protein, partial [Microcystis sp.]